MTKAIAKVSSSGFTDVIRNGVTARVFYNNEYVIVVRADKMITSDLPYVPILVTINTANETPYEKYREVVFSLMVNDDKDWVFRTSGEFINKFPKKDREKVTRIVSALYKKYYSLQVMIM